jgi:hypothetical protein
MSHAWQESGLKPSVLRTLSECTAAAFVLVFMTLVRCYSLPGTNDSNMLLHSPSNS